MKEAHVNDVPEGAQFIDVREPDEYAEAHAKGTVNLPLSQFVQLCDQINPDEPAYIICRSGGRSAQAIEYMEQSRGWDNGINVLGGTNEWIEQQLPLGD
ncbi:rhodanese-like domain-containing protein [Corynebacterium breve]|uniref:Rhodanese-like domain-containing protein n=1 Tax=Corynebacterium breve TaxID=3049799 RepID=A0ABY8VCI4_9CORY|nr:rhodanese-like domain-containing protein [Corynebacterium breve]WIM67376.1 rhodanese-like domain-containing protein [Corynebacterium breve]